MRKLPFDLGKALCGAPVVTREGHPVSRVVDMRPYGCEQKDCVVAVIGGNLYNMYPDGLFLIRDKSGYDLFLAASEPERVTTYHLHTPEWLSEQLSPNVDKALPGLLTLVREKQPDGSWKIIGTDQLAEEARNA